MESDRISALGDWRVDASQCRCLPVFSMLRLDRDDQGGIHLRVSWGDADQEAVLTRSGGKLETGRATFLFSTADGEQHLLVAAVHAEPIAIYLTNATPAPEGGAGGGAEAGTRTREQDAERRLAAGADAYAAFRQRLPTLDERELKTIVIERTGLVR